MRLKLTFRRAQTKTGSRVKRGIKGWDVEGQGDRWPWACFCHTGKLKEKTNTQIHKFQPKAFIETQGLSRTLLNGFLLAQLQD